MKPSQILLHYIMRNRALKMLREHENHKHENPKLANNYPLILEDRDGRYGYHVVNHFLSSFFYQQYMLDIGKGVFDAYKRNTMLCLLFELNREHCDDDFIKNETSSTFKHSLYADIAGIYNGFLMPILQKMARVFSGSRLYLDNWVDILLYVKLFREHFQKEFVLDRNGNKINLSPPQASNVVGGSAAFQENISAMASKFTVIEKVSGKQYSLAEWFGSGKILKKHSRYHKMMKNFLKTIWNNIYFKTQEDFEPKINNLNYHEDKGKYRKIPFFSFEKKYFKKFNLHHKQPLPFILNGVLDVFEYLQKLKCLFLLQHNAYEGLELKKCQDASPDEGAQATSLRHDILCNEAFFYFLFDSLVKIESNIATLIEKIKIEKNKNKI